MGATKKIPCLGVTTVVHVVWWTERGWNGYCSNADSNRNRYCHYYYQQRESKRHPYSFRFLSNFYPKSKEK